MGITTLGVLIFLIASLYGRDFDSIGRVGNCVFGAVFLVYAVAYAIILWYFWSNTLKNSRVYCPPTSSKLFGITMVTGIAVASILCLPYLCGLIMMRTNNEKIRTTLAFTLLFLLILMFISMSLQMLIGFHPARGCRLTVVAGTQ